MSGQQHLQRKQGYYVFIIRIIWRDRVGLSQKRGLQNCTTGKFLLTDNGGIAAIIPTWTDHVHKVHSCHKI